MDNKAVMKAMVSGAKVRTADRELERIVDYTINAAKDGTISYTAGCLDEKNHYWSIPCDDLICDADLHGVKYGNGIGGYEIISACYSRQRSLSADRQAVSRCESSSERTSLYHHLCRCP